MPERRPPIGHAATLASGPPAPIPRDGAGELGGGGPEGPEWDRDKCPPGTNESSVSNCPFGLGKSGYRGCSCSGCSAWPHIRGRIFRSDGSVQVTVWGFIWGYFTVLLFWVASGDLSRLVVRPSGRKRGREGAPASSRIGGLGA